VGTKGKPTRKKCENEKNWTLKVADAESEEIDKEYFYENRLGLKVALNRLPPKH
jgi:hypothetical protein